ncbi:MAG TPA: RsmE family RNA methyltransferase [Bdellovibrionales bacterium]|nr:RsmE family RNA methyltransferase [Bdellovibrionales bacterium]
MRRYWVEKEALDGDVVRLSGDTLHHIRDVCRMHLGSKFEVIVDGGNAHLVEIFSESKKESVAKILETRAIPELPRPHLHLALSIPRFPVFEAVLEKCVELGVKEIHPFFSEFSFIRTQADTWDKKLPRFEKIVQSATQQCGRGELMSIASPISLKDLLDSFNRTKGAAGLFLYEGAGTLSAKDGVEKVRSSDPEDVWMFVGSEGGFADKEVELFRSVGLATVTLGPQVLRVETACVASVSILKYGLDLMR